MKQSMNDVYIRYKIRSIYSNRTINTLTQQPNLNQNTAIRTYSFQTKHEFLWYAQYDKILALYNLPKLTGSA